MLYETFCGINVNLIKAGVAVGIVEILAIIVDVIDDIEFYSEGKVKHRSDLKQILKYKIHF